MHGKIAIVTGASAGIGEDLALRLAERGAFVIMGCRNMKKCEVSRSKYGQFANNTVCGQIDLSDMKSIRSFAEQVNDDYGESGIDFLLNNAGGVFSPSKTAQGLEMNLGVMHFGHYLLTKLLTPLLKNPSREKEHGSARVVNHASIAGLGVVSLHDSVYDQPDGEGSLRGELPSLAGCSDTLTDISESKGARLCPFWGSYSYAKLWQIGITPMQQEDFDAMPGRKVITFAKKCLVVKKVKSKIHADTFF